MNGLCTPGLNSIFFKIYSGAFPIATKLLLPFLVHLSTLEAWWLSCKQLQRQGTKSARGWKHRQKVAARSGTDCISNWASLPRPVTRQELAGTVLTSWGVSHHTPTHQMKRPRHPHTEHTDRGGARSLWLQSAVTVINQTHIRQGFERCICHSKISYRAQSTATRGSGHQQAAEALCWSLRWMRWAFISFPISFSRASIHTNKDKHEE